MSLEGHLEDVSSMQMTVWLTSMSSHCQTNWIKRIKRAQQDISVFEVCKDASGLQFDFAWLSRNHISIPVRCCMLLTSILTDLSLQFIARRTKL